jgi:Leucine-rich repeat (LRR) protein
MSSSKDTNNAGVDQIILKAIEEKSDTVELNSLNLETWPEKLSSLSSSLQRLAFCNNKLKEAPHDLSQFTFLRYLTLKGNLLKTFPLSV